MTALLLQGLSWACTGGEASLGLKIGRHAAEAWLSSAAEFGPQLASPQQWGSLAWLLCKHALLFNLLSNKAWHACLAALELQHELDKLGRLLCC